MGKHVFMGTEEGSCGIDCLRMVLADLSKDKGYLYLNPGKAGGYSLEELIKVAASEGLELKGYQAADKEELSKEKGPLMLVLEGEGDSHMVVYDGTFMGMARIRDPEGGRRYVSYKKLLAKWTGDYLAPSNYTGSGYCGPLPEKKKAEPYWLPLLSSLAGQMLLLTGLYFVRGENTGMAVPIACLTGFALFQVLSEVLAGKAIAKYDERYLPLISLEGNLRGEYAAYCRHKADSFSRPMAICLNLLSACFLLALFAFNDTSFVLPLGGAFALCLIDSFFAEPYIARRTRRLGRLEKEAFSAPEGKRLEPLEAAAKEGQSLGRIISYKRVVSVFALGLLALWATGFGTSLSLNYFLFAFFGLYAIHRCLKGCFDALSGYDASRAAETAFQRKRLAPRGGGKAV